MIDIGEEDTPEGTIIDTGKEPWFDALGSVMFLLWAIFGISTTTILINSPSTVFLGWIGVPYVANGLLWLVFRTTNSRIFLTIIGLVGSLYSIAFWGYNESLLAYPMGLFATLLLCTCIGTLCMRGLTWFE
ncbi:MAG: hypothetical protein JW779_00560 [Candidatus Thorarchaeota archaeon]|nr:hypothetical protein [Candidatus Thorarchaeota archaeon]